MCEFKIEVVWRRTSGSCFYSSNNASMLPSVEIGTLKYLNFIMMMTINDSDQNEICIICIVTLVISVNNIQESATTSYACGLEVL